MAKKFTIKKKDLDLLVYDFDGVLTDNKVLVFDDGTEAVWCNRADGLAIHYLKKAGIPQLILSMETNPVVATRAKKLGIPVLSGIEEKKIVLEKYCREKNYALSRTLYVGNDINDLETMQLVQYPIAPQDAHPRVKRIAKYITAVKGGDGVIKEIFDKLIQQ